MRILLGYPGHAFSTIDVATGYEQALRRVGQDVQVYDYNNILAFYDAALQEWQKRGSYRMSSGDTQMMASERIAIQALDFAPDVALIVSGLSYHPRAFDLLYRLNVPVVVLLTECPYIDAEQITMVKRSHAVGVLVNDRVSQYKTFGAVARYLPHSYDIERHRRVEVGEEYASDVFFFGTMWPERWELLEGLPGRIDGPRPDQSPMKHLANEELVRWYSGTKIALNHHRTAGRVNEVNQVEHIGAGEAWSLGPRSYEIAAVGAFQLCDNTRGELREVFGDSVPTYRGRQELAELIRYYLEHPEEREACAREAHERVAGCSFDERAKNIVVPFLEEVIHNGKSLPR
jgi:hypothetical protein